METFTVLSIGIAAALGVMAGVMLLSLDSGVGTPALAANRKSRPADSGWRADVRPQGQIATGAIGNQRRR